MLWPFAKTPSWGRGGGRENKESSIRSPPVTVDNRSSGLSCPIDIAAMDEHDGRRASGDATRLGGGTGDPLRQTRGPFPDLNLLPETGYEDAEKKIKNIFILLLASNRMMEQHV